MLKPVCNDKRCPGKTCEGEKQGKSFYAGFASGTRACVTRVYKAYRARKQVALADLVDMGVRELAGRDPKMQVDVKREDLLRYEGKVGLCESCRLLLLSDQEKAAMIKKKRGNLCKECGNRAIDGYGSKPPCDACAAKRAAAAAAAAGAGAGPST